MIPFTRIMTMLMFVALGVLLIVPTALRQHNVPLAIFAIVALVAYLAINIVIWRRMKSRP